MKWDEHVLNVGAPGDVDSISETIDAVFMALNIHGASHFSFTGLTPSQVSPEHLAAALRATSCLRTKVIDWDDGLRTARAAAAEQGLDPDDLLYGMVSEP